MNESEDTIVKPEIPLGMDAIAEAGFRELYHHYLYIHCREVLDDIIHDDLHDDDTGMLVYCYIDPEAGLSYRPLALAQYNNDDGTLAFRRMPDQLGKCVFRYHSKYIKQEYPGDEGTLIMATITAQDHRFINVSQDMPDVDLSVFSDEEKAVHENYDLIKNPKKEELRSEKYSYMDKYRHPACPDDVMVVLFRPDVKPESVWVRCEFEAENEVFGRMMTEPKTDFHIHKGTVIGFVPYGEGDEMILVATGHTARTIS